MTNATNHPDPTARCATHWPQRLLVDGSCPQCDALAAMETVVLFGDDPTPQALALGDAVAEHIANRPTEPKPTPDPDVLAQLRKEEP